MPSAYPTWTYFAGAADGQLIKFVASRQKKAEWCGQDIANVLGDHVSVVREDGAVLGTYQPQRSYTIGRCMKWMEEVT